MLNLFHFIVELVPICRDDLVVLPKKLANSLGGCSQLLLCTRISNSIHLTDTNTLHPSEVSHHIYWRTPFLPLASAKAMTEYYVLDVEPLETVRGKYVLADIHVARAADFGRNDEETICRSHLGAILNPGDTVLGYDLKRSNFNNDAFDTLDHDLLPDVVLVRKSYPARRKKNKQRPWQIKQLGKEVDEMLPRKQDQAKMDQDMEMFMRDIEEDSDFRATVNIFKASQKGESADGATATTQEGDDTATDGEEEEEDFPEVSLEEMMDEMHISMDDVDTVL